MLKEMLHTILHFPYLKSKINRARTFHIGLENKFIQMVELLPENPIFGKWEKL